MSEAKTHDDEAVEASPNRPVLPVHSDPEVDVRDAEPAYGTTAEDHVRWSISNWCAINYSEDFDQIGDGRGLHACISTRNDVYIRTVTPDQLRTHAAHLIGLADRAEKRAARSGGEEGP